MRLQFFTNGKPAIQCPNCQKWHTVQRKPAQLGKPQYRFSCRGCGTTIRATDEERAAIKEYYEKNYKKREPKQKPPEPNKEPKQPPKTPEPKPPEPKKPKKSEKQKSWLESIFD